MSLPGTRLAAAVDYRREVFARGAGGEHDSSGRRAVAAGHPDEGGVRERDRGRDGARRVHERRVAPARDRARGGVDLRLDDFDRISRRTPHLVDVRPAGRFVMSDLDRVGGVPVVMKELLDAGSCTATA